MIWTPSPRPPWSEWLMNSTLRDATACMAYLSAFESLSPPTALEGQLGRRRGSWFPTRSASRQRRDEQQGCYQKHRETQLTGAQHPHAEEGERTAEWEVGEPAVSVIP